MESIASLGLTGALDPRAVAIVAALGYAVWLGITREPSVFATARRIARRNTLRLGRVCAGTVALSWVVTFPPPERSTAGDVLESMGFALATLFALSVVAAVRAVVRAWRRPERMSRVNAVVAARTNDRAASGHPGTKRREAGTPSVAGKEADRSAPPRSGSAAVEPARAAPRSRFEYPPRLAGESAEEHDARRTALARLASEVRTHALDEIDSDLGEAAPVADGTARDALASAASDLPNAPVAPPEGASPSLLRRRLAELSAEIATLRRVAIAQRAELDFEREAHARSRESARKALDVARRAMAERRTAIKLARRERRARLELEGRLGFDAAVRRDNARALVDEEHD